MLDDDDDDDEDGENDSSEWRHSSDWILRLIAKKRAQLKAAKRARRKQRHLRRKQFLRSFACHRQ